MACGTLRRKQVAALCTFFWLAPCSGEVIKRGTDDWKKLNQLVLEQFKEQSYLKLNRTTAQGKILSCELEFSGGFTDTRYQVGDAIFVSGSLSLFYFKDKAPVYGLKVKAMRISDSLSSGNPLEAMNIAFAGFLVGSEDFEEFKTVDKMSDTGHFLTGYGDSSLMITLKLATEQLESVRIVFAPDGNGFDLDFAPAEFSDYKQLIYTDAEFSQCSLDVLEAIQGDMPASE